MAHEDHHDHDHSHGHAHDHGHHHHHQPGQGAAFAIGMALNAGFVVAEVVFGLFGHSVALLADAGHNLSDVLGLAVAWFAASLTRRAPTARFTYGLGGGTILAALFNAVFLLVVIGGLSWEALRRFAEPEPVAGKTVMIVAACGIVVNGICAWLFAAGREKDLNLRGAFTHMAADALVSLGVVVSGALILFTGWLWLDPLTSLLVNAIIIWGTWGLLTGSLAMSVNAVPAGINMADVSALLLALPGVESLHDLHVWPISTTETALSCHLVMPQGHPGDDAWLEAAMEQLAERFGIGHITLQPEIAAPTAEHLAATHNY
jgi:cobalt-zinc-cadmium efflux system protein